MTTDKENIIKIEKNNIEKSIRLEDIKYSFQNYGSFIVFFLGVAAAASSITVSLPIALAAATGAGLSFLYNLRTTNQHISRDKKYTKLMKNLEALKDEEPINDEYNAVYDYEKKNLNFKQAEDDYEIIQVANAFTTGLAVVGAGLCFTNPIAVSLSAIGLAGSYFVSKKAIRCHKKRELADAELKISEYKLQVSGIEPKKEKTHVMDDPDILDDEYENTYENVSRESYSSDKEKVYTKKKRD